MVSRRSFLGGALAAAPALLFDSRLGPCWRTTPSIVLLRPPGDTPGLAGARFAAAELHHTSTLLSRSIEVRELAVRTPADVRQALRDARAANVCGVVSVLGGAPREALPADADVPVIDAASDGFSAAPCGGAMLRTGVDIGEAARAAVSAIGRSDVVGTEWMLVADPLAPAALRRRLTASLASAGGTLLPALPPDEPLARLAGAPPAGVFVAMPSADTADLLRAMRGHPALSELRVVSMTAMPEPAPSGEPWLEIVGWHPTLFRYGATQLNDRFVRFAGAGMHGDHWSAWIAVKLLGEAALRGSGRRGVREMLADPEARFDGHKGTPLSFRPADGWLRQPLYVVRHEAGGSGAAVEVDQIPYTEDAVPLCLEGEQ